MDPRIGFARRLARKTLQEFGRAAQPPVPIEEIIRFCGLTLHRERGVPAFSGTLRGDRIIVNANHPETRQRFTAAHELGHALLGHSCPELGFVEHLAIGDEAATVYADPAYAQEVEANQFAAELLAPRAWVKQHWRRLRDPDKLAALFLLSRQAMWLACLRAGCIRGP